MRSLEWATLAYCAYCCVIALAHPSLPARRRAAVALGAIAIASLAAWAPAAPWRDTFALRDWILPAAVYLLGGYYLSGLFYVAPMPRIERRLVALDRRLDAAAWSARLPTGVLEFLELSYLAVYAMVGLGPLVAYAAAGAAEVERFWIIVLTADYICFACMPWAQTRTPRALEGNPPASRSRVRRLNLAVLGRFSHERNTFPSGHAAEALAVVLALAHISPSVSLALAPLALAVGAGSVAGRYHFAADAIAGYLVALVVWLAFG
ncbi:MAG: phosphatase PAP2 family protein [Vicinamibacterales bacterium]